MEVLLPSDCNAYQWPFDMAFNGTPHGDFRLIDTAKRGWFRWLEAS